MAGGERKTVASFLASEAATGETVAPGTPTLASKVQKQWLHFVTNAIFQATSPNTIQKHRGKYGLTFFFFFFFL